MKHLIVAAFIMSLGCGPQYVQDPNAYVLVTSKYENEPERIIRPTGKECKPQFDCKDMPEAACSIALYHESDKFIKEGRALMEKKLYLSARVEFMLAMSRLIEAEIRLKRAKTTNFEDYKTVTTFKLGERVRESIKLCERLIRFTQHVPRHGD